MVRFDILKETIIPDNLETSYTLTDVSAYQWQQFMTKLTFYKGEKVRLSAANVADDILKGIQGDVADIAKYLVPLQGSDYEVAYSDVDDRFTIEFVRVPLGKSGILTGNAYKPVVTVRFPESPVINVSTQLRPMGGSLIDAVGVLLRISSPFTGIQMQKIQHNDGSALHVAPADKLPDVIQSSQKLAEKLVASPLYDEFMVGYGASPRDQFVKDYQHCRQIANLLRIIDVDLT